MPNLTPAITFPGVIDRSGRSARIIALILSAAEILRIVGFVNVSVSYAIIIPLMIIPVFALGFFGSTEFRRAYLLFLIYIPLELIVAAPSSVFHSWQRYLLFAVLLCAVSPFLQNEKLRYFRFCCLKYFLAIILPVSAASFFCYLLGINYFTNEFGDGIDYIQSVGGFGGLFKHSMVLGPMCAMSTCASIWLAFAVRKRKLIFIILAIICLGGTLFSASRAAVIGAVISSIVVILCYNRKRSKGIKILLVVAIIGALTYPLWERALHGITTKNLSNTELGIYGSRTNKFTARIAEIQSSPTFGVGFSAIDPKGSDLYNVETGVIEPGSSWLGVVSMTGIIGLAFIVYFMISAFLTLRRSGSIYSPLLIGLLCFFAIHFIFEGYIFAGGSTLCFLFWLILGVSTDLGYADKQSLTSTSPK